MESDERANLAAIRGFATVGCLLLVSMTSCSLSSDYHRTERIKAMTAAGAHPIDIECALSASTTNAPICAVRASKAEK